MVNLIGCHVIEHFTKFHILFPMRSKQAKEVVLGLKEHVFSVLIILLWTLPRHGSENVNWSMEKQDAPGCKNMLKKETSVEMMITAKCHELGIIVAKDSM